eukprot:CAMPEP_0197627080 /NCGR_PEP_ID=MMETSP1338-20131121/5790_1 /TAXON_ID=43686 ORGANISM="Pelagodinium beii, Strain RCC1491" /NCGR_SAMPLE_ID=MMETSP1338 /ASSEMBLY_ACC=CAM_ASM_000754 /LENGTH=314 /DNA_ID=CAMNT_0043197699 /DNA_START=31 /DNA_END=975 /DNA_ORIENTATION=-
MAWPAQRHRARQVASMSLLAAAVAGACSSALLFAALPTSWSKVSGDRFCGQRMEKQSASTALAASATLSWINPRSWAAPEASVSDRLSPREWLRMYRTLGLASDADRQQVGRATTRLRKKYAEDEAALERVEAANLWLMTKLISQREDARRAKQQANRLRELGDSPRRLFHKYVAGYIPPGIRQMIEPPNTKHFRWASGLLGAFALIGLCVPSQATNFVGLGAASSMGLVYQRGRPEPVKDEMGNVGRVQKPPIKEMGITIALILSGVGIGTLTSYLLALALKTEFQACFCPTVLLVLWVISLFFKVYGIFEDA